MLKNLLRWLPLFVHYVDAPGGGGTPPPGGGTPPPGGGTPPPGGGTPPPGGTPPGGGTPPPGGTPPGGGTPPPSAWPDNWRQIYAGDDAKKLQRLERYGSPAAVIDSLLTVQQRIGAGELRSVLPKDADPAALATWRTENGIPEDPTKYELKLKDGLVIGDADKPYIEAFLKKAHGTHANSAQASAVVEAYYEITEQQAEQRQADDAAAAKEAINALAAEWGGEYKGNMNLVHGLLDSAPPGVKETILAGRGPDGKPLMADPNLIRTLNAWAREINPVTTVVPNAGANIGTAIEDEIKGIETAMRDKNGEYYKGTMETRNGRTDTKMAHRYTELLDAREKVKKKG